MSWSFDDSGGEGGGVLVKKKTILAQAFFKNNPGPVDN